MKIEDLDILRPEQRIIRLGEKEIDVSFIPCGITFEIDRIVQELRLINQSSILENGEGTKKAFTLSIEMCAAFCSHKYPELDFDWFMENVDANQIKVFSSAIRDALVKAYSGVQVNLKNLRVPKRKSK